MRTSPKVARTILGGEGDVIEQDRTVQDHPLGRRLTMEVMKDYWRWFDQNGTPHWHKPVWSEECPCWVVLDAKGVRHFNVCETNRRRRLAVDHLLRVKAEYSELDGWSRIIMHPKSVSDMIWFVEPSRGLAGLAQGNPMHLTMTLKRNHATMSDARKADLNHVKQWCGGVTWYTYIRFRHVTSFSEAGGFIGHPYEGGFFKDDDNPEALLAIKRLRSGPGEHGGALTISL